MMVAGKNVTKSMSGGRRGSGGTSASKDGSPSIDSLVALAKSEGPKPVYIISGDEFLVSQAANTLVDGLIPKESRDFNLSILDGSLADPSTIARELAQAPMFPGIKLVWVRDTALLTGKSDLEGEFARAHNLFKEGRESDAARRLLALIGKANWSITDLTESSARRWEKDLSISPTLLDQEFLRKIQDIAVSESMAIPANDTAVLERLLNGGAPPLNSLVLTCEKPDRRLTVTKLMEKIGAHLVCKAERQGREVEDFDIGAIKKSVLDKYGKRLDPRAEQALKRAIGEELRLLAMELEKLCLFVGDAQVIRASDVEAIGVRQIREEAFWELGNAVTSRSLADSLWYLQDAYEHGRHPVQVLSGLAAALRKALQVRSTAEQHGVSRLGRGDLPASVVEAVASQRGGRKPHPFALKMEYQRSMSWPSTTSIAKALDACRVADRDLKTSRGDPQLVVERLIMRLCER